MPQIWILLGFQKFAHFHHRNTSFPRNYSNKVNGTLVPIYMYVIEN